MEVGKLDSSGGCVKSAQSRDMIEIDLLVQRPPMWIGFMNDDSCKTIS